MLAAACLPGFSKEDPRLTDIVIRRQNRHHTGLQLDRHARNRPADSGRGIAAFGLLQYLIRRHLRQLSAHRLGKPLGGTYPDRIRLDDRAESRGRDLQKALLARDRQQLFGSCSAAQRPESSAAATCQNQSWHRRQSITRPPGLAAPILHGGVTRWGPARAGSRQATGLGGMPSSRCGSGLTTDDRAASHGLRPPLEPGVGGGQGASRSAAPRMMCQAWRT